MLRVKLEDSVQGFCNIVMVVFDYFSLQLGALREGTEFLSAIEA